MKNLLVPCLAALLAAGVATAGPVDVAIVAAMKPSEQSNYTWTTTIVRDARTYTVEGKTLVGSYTQVTVPADVAMPASPGGRGRMGRGSSDSDTVVIFKGDENHVIETPEGWMTPEEFAKWSAFSGTPAPQRMGPGRRRGGRGFAAELPLAFAISQPHEDLGIIVSSYASINIDGGVVSGRLTETGARLLLLPPGQTNVTPEQAAGSFKLWITEGVLTKYEVQVEGVVAITGTGKDRREVKTTQTITTELKNFGSTKLDVPAEAKKKLG